MEIFIKCPKCKLVSCVDGVLAVREDLAMFRGSEHPIKCKGCQADIDTMTAFCGERTAAGVERREDPKSFWRYKSFAGGEMAGALRPNAYSCTRRSTHARGFSAQHFLTGANQFRL